MSDTFLDIRVIGPTLARRLATARSAAAARAVLDELAPGLPESEARAPLPLAADHLGPWHPVYRNGETWFERERDDDAAHLWSDAKTILPRGAAPRVVLLGESVARGWGLDPLCNPCSHLRELWRHHPAGDVEVVDLARNGMLPGELLSTMRAARDLEADVYVVFAGNNWLLPSPDDFDVRAAGAAVTGRRSWRPVGEAIARAVTDQTSALVKDLAGIARDHNARLVLVVPASNLRDWAPDPSWINPLLDSATRQRRDALLASAEAALDRGDVKAAETLLWQTVACEDGIAPTALYKLGQCALARDDADAAWRLLERARDAVLSLTVPAVPACFGATAQATRERGQLEGAVVVDLSWWLRHVRGGTPPGRELFLDSVHMTAEGIRLAACAIAAAVGPLIGRSVDDDALQAVPIAVTPEAVAQGHLCAALYAARCGQPLETIRWQIEAAIAADAGIVEAIACYVDRAVRRAPDVLCASFGRLLRLETQYPGLRYFRNRWREEWRAGGHRHKRVDLELIQRLCEAIRPHQPHECGRLLELLSEEHRLDRRPIDAGMLSGFEPPLGAVGHGKTGGGILRAVTPETTLRFVVSEEAADVTVRLTARVPRRARGGQAALFVNGVPAHAWTVEDRWQTVVCTLPAPLLRPGTNALTIRWPEGEYSLVDRAAEIAARLEQLAEAGRRSLFPAGLLPGVHATFGEIHQLTLGAAEPVAPVAVAAGAEAVAPV
jgi:hypothetical protein